MKLLLLCVSLVMTLMISGCSNPLERTVELKRFPLDSLDGIITRSGAELDKDNTSDGNGSLRIITNGPTTVRLLEVNDLGVEDARLIYQAKVRVRDFEGQVYLEMACHFADNRELFSRNPESAIAGSTGWVSMETSHPLKKGENPNIVKLNLVVNGRGKVWIDDVRLMKASLK